MGASLGSSRLPAQFGLAEVAFVVLFPEGMLLVRGHDERDHPRRQTAYLLANQLAVLLLAVCAFTAQRLL